MRLGFQLKTFLDAPSCHLREREHTMPWILRADETKCYSLTRK